MALRDTYKKRLKDHLKETKGHARLLERRIKKLGGKAEAARCPRWPEVAQAAQTATKKAAALAQGPLHAARGLSPAEKQLKNAKTEYSEEHEEIANYTAIETLAEAVGDKETAKLARDIRRDEERMAKFLAGQITVMSKQVAREEIPAPSARRAEAVPGRGAQRPRPARSLRALAGALLAAALGVHVGIDRSACSCRSSAALRSRSACTRCSSALACSRLAIAACCSASASRAWARAPRTSASWRWSRASTRRCWFLTCLRLLPPTMAAIRTITTTMAMMISTVSMVAVLSSGGRPPRLEPR